MDDADVELALANHADAIMDLAIQTHWMYVTHGFITRQQAVDALNEFNDEHQLVADLTVVDLQEFEDLTPEMFDEAEPNGQG